MLVPRILFNEENVGVQPIVTGIRNRIGMVGQFSRGPANTFSFIEGFTDFANRYGSDTQSGSVAFQAAFDMGAREFGLVRVLGGAREACGDITIAGEATKANTLILYLNFIGQATPYYPTVLESPIITSGAYTGSTDGRYVFYVDDYTAPVYTIKYAFRDLATYPTVAEAVAAVDWTQTASPSVPEGYDGSFTANDDSGGGQATLVGNGFSIAFGAPNPEGLDFFFRVGDIFTVRTNADNYSIPVPNGATVSELTPDIIATLSGNLPINEVTSSTVYSGSGAGSYTDTITFCLGPELAGAVGNGYTYYTELAEPDGDAIIQFDYPDTTAATTNELTTTDPNAAFLVVSTSTSGGTATDSSLIDEAGGFGINADIIWDLDSVGDIIVTDVTENAGTYTVTFSEDSRSGLAAGSIYLRLLNPGGGLTVSNYTVSLLSNLRGGLDGPSNALLDLYTLNGLPLIRLLAVSPGAWGNGLRASVQPLTGAQWRLTLTDTQGQDFNPPIASESYIIDLSQPGATTSAGTIVALQNSNLVRGQFLPQRQQPTSFNVSLLSQVPQRAGIADESLTGQDAFLDNYAHPAFYGPAKLVDLPFVNGFDGPPLEEQDWVKAINVLENTRTHIILAPSVTPELPSAQAQLIAVAENSTELEGLKIAILSAKPALTVPQAEQQTLGLDSRRAIMVAGWSTYSGQVNAPRFSLSPDALLAGRLGDTAYFVSPSARTSSGSIQGIIEVDTQNSNSLTTLQLFTDAKLEIIALDAALSAFYFTNGRTLSNDVAWDRVVIRRTYDVIRQDLFQNLQRYKSEPHTKLLRKQITTAINAYFATMARNGYIANYRSAICDDSNNFPENYTTGELNVDVFFLPLYAADYINVTITRTSSSGLQIGEV